MSKPRRRHDALRLAFGETARHSAFEGGHRVEAARLAIRQRPHAALAQVQEPGGASGEARGRRGLGEAGAAKTGQVLSAFATD